MVFWSRKIQKETSTTSWPLLWFSKNLGTISINLFCCALPCTFSTVHKHTRNKTSYYSSLNPHQYFLKLKTKLCSCLILLSAPVNYKWPVTTYHVTVVLIYLSNFHWRLPLCPSPSKMVLCGADYTSHQGTTSWLPMLCTWFTTPTPIALLSPPLKCQSRISCSRFVNCQWQNFLEYTIYNICKYV